MDLVGPVGQGIPGNLVLPSDLEVQGVLVGQVTPIHLFALIILAVPEVLGAQNPADLVRPSDQLVQGYHLDQAVPSPREDQEGQDDRYHLLAQVVQADQDYPEALRYLLVLEFLVFLGIQEGPALLLHLDCLAIQANQDFQLYLYCLDYLDIQANQDRPLVQADQEYQCLKDQDHLSPLSVREIQQAQAAPDVLLFLDCLYFPGDLEGPSLPWHLLAPEVLLVLAAQEAPCLP